MKFHYHLYFISLCVIYMIYALAFLGIFSTVPGYVIIWHLAVQIFLCLFLMFRYHPFRNTYKFKPIDARLIFGAAMLLFVNIMLSIPIFSSMIVGVNYNKQISLQYNKADGGNI